MCEANVILEFVPKSKSNKCKLKSLVIPTLNENQILITCAEVGKLVLERYGVEKDKN